MTALQPEFATVPLKELLPPNSLGIQYGEGEANWSEKGLGQHLEMIKQVTTSFQSG